MPAHIAAAQVLVVDDEPDLRTLYELALLREGYHVDSAGSLAQARELLGAKRFDVVISDMRLPDGLGLELLKDLAAQQRAERCVVMTAYGSAENAVEALKAGAFDYLTKPVDLKQFRGVVASAIQNTASLRPPVASRGADDAPEAQPASAAGSSALERLVGTSRVMQQVKERVSKVARSMAPVLVRGESGTGKELVARAIHDCSHRCDGPFVAVNCGAIPEALLEAEFFGARKGSYTGSTRDREGYFQAAGGGTLFLDEIGDLPVAMQSKLLRAIQERKVRAIGSTQEDTIDVRIVSATHKDVSAEVAAGRFRQDLYYRLNVIEIVTPPLRERRGDLPALCRALLARIAQETGMPAPRLSPELLLQLAEHPLTGNVRELENLLHRAVALYEGDALQVDLASCATAAVTPPPDATTLPLFPAVLAANGDLEPPAANAAPAARADAQRLARAPRLNGGSGPALVPNDLEAYLDQHEREILVRALRESGFNRTAAAQRLGLSLRQIRYRIARLGITAPGADDANEEAA
ncbi:MAG TPA: sigma-54 dependent transcriptional regulator [Ramlibacter sp.]|nr:sigma-54 dependent transcriptional regulator [Ramlibacter sp.]